MARKRKISFVVNVRRAWESYSERSVVLYFQNGVTFLRMNVNGDNQKIARVINPKLGEKVKVTFEVVKGWK